MIIKKAHSLSTRIVLSVALVFFLLFFAIFLVFGKITKDALYTAEKDKAEIIAEMIAPMLAVELYLGRNENVLAIADQITANPNILSFELVQDGQRIVRRKNTEIDSSDTDEDFNVETELIHPVNHHPIAKLHLSYSSEHYHHLARQYRMVFLILLGVLSLLIFLFTFYLRHLLTPLKRIASEVAGFTPGQELSLPPYKKNNEISDIATALKVMNIRISDYAEQQENTAQILEQEVAKKTSQLRRQLYTDALTGLPNRTRLMEDIGKARHGVLILVNIDEFRQINDFYGHIAGDHVLNTLAKTLTHLSKNETDMSVYKLSADEFALFTDHALDYHNLELLLNELNTVIEATPIDYEEARLNIRSTLGATMNIVEGMEKADIALKTARSRHKPFMIYDGSLNIEHQYHQNMQWTQRLTAAISEDRIVPYYQPIFDNRSGAVSSYECLVRLVEPDGNVLTPFHFLEISKKARLYPRLTMIMVEKSCRHFSGRPDHFSINLSVDDILNEDTVLFIKEQIETHRVAEQIIFEILESVGIENYPEILSFIEEMKALGCRFSIDDFGSGYSNFEHLLQLKIDYIKIDGSLIRNLHTDANAISIIQAIVYFANKRNLICIAEFVHNAEVYEIVKELGIERSQGFHLGEPLPDTL
ncbi:EAL domain-containing protein [Sulfurimonas sp. HSL3-7]|uniref:EAL domain-containing protein n=1 Tax=Sulfonitrofixus jiaomeiensis TaxID=3131938 RepID=UPI0031F8CBAB